MTLKRFTSTARWSTGQFTHDEHDSKDMAIKIAETLFKKFSKNECPERGFCRQSWVTEREKGITHNLIKIFPARRREQ
jgi:hypothetical protein